VLAVVAFLLLRPREDVGGTSVFTDSIAAGPRPLVRLENEVGRVRIEGARGTEEVRVVARRHARGPNPEEATRNAAEIPVSVEPGDEGAVSVSSGEGGAGVEYDLEVPPGSSAEVVSGAGEVEVVGLDGAVEVRSEAGDVEVREARGSVEVESQAGDVRVGPVATDTGAVTLAVGSGDVELEDLVVGRLEARVETGSVTLGGRFRGVGEVSVGTGNVYVRVPEESAANLGLEARVGEVVREGAAEGAGEGG
jgi:hypothetical protein